MPYEKKLSKYLAKQVKGVKDGTIKTHPWDRDKMDKSFSDRHHKRLAETCPTERILAKISFKVKELQSDRNFILDFVRILKESKILKVSEFLTGELITCSIHTTGKCNCYHDKKDPKKNHPNGKVKWSTDIGVYDPSKKDHRWFFVVEVKEYDKKMAAATKKFEKKHGKPKRHKNKYPCKKDPLVESMYKFEAHEDIFNLIVDKSYFTKEDVVIAVKKFIKDYFEIDKKVVYKD